MRCSTLLKLTALLIFAVSANSFATSVVFPQGDVDSLYQAVQRAKDISADTIYIMPGTHPAFLPGEGDDVGTGIVVDIPLRIIGKNSDPSAVVLDMQWRNRALRIDGTAGGTSISGITFIHGLAAERGAYGVTKGEPGVQDDEDPLNQPAPGEAGADATNPGYGGAIDVQGVNVTIENCIFRNCIASGGIGGRGADGEDADADSGLTGGYGAAGGAGEGNGFGGALSFRNSSSTVKNCIFQNNIARGGVGGDGGDGGDADGSGKTSSSGSGGAALGAGLGGAVYADSGSPVVMINCVFSGNQTKAPKGGAGGALGAGDENDSTAEIGSDGYVPSYSDPNNVPSDGGAIYLEASAGSGVVIQDCTFTENVALYNGGAIYGATNSILHILDTDDSTVTFYKNKAGDNGGAINFQGAKLGLVACDFVSNSVQDDYDEFYKYDDINNEYYYITVPKDTVGSASGGAIFAAASVNPATNGELNTAAQELYTSDGAPATSLHDIYSDDSIPAEDQLTLDECNAIEGFYRSVFSTNTAQYDGGAICSEAGAAFTFIENTLTGNIADEGEGGAINTNYQRASGPSTIIMKNTTLSQNVATEGEGGAVHSYETQITVNDSYINNNTSASGGGAWHFDKNDSGNAIAFDNVSFDFNETTAANSIGGALYILNVGDIDFNDCVFRSNVCGGTSGGAAFVMDSTVDLTNILVTENSAELNGGAFSYNFGSRGTIKNATFVQNYVTTPVLDAADGISVDGGSGGALYAFWDSFITVDNSIFYDNRSIAIAEGDDTSWFVLNNDLFGLNKYGTNDVGDYGNYNPAKQLLDVFTGTTDLETYVDDNMAASVASGILETADEEFFDTTGSLGDYYLSAGSIAIDAGNETAVAAGLDGTGYTTLAANTPDTGDVDLGYHYTVFTLDQRYEVRVSVPENGSVVIVDATSDDLYYPGQVLELTANPNSGWRVQRWVGSDNDASNEKTNTVVVNANKTVSAVFEQPNTYHYDGEGSTLQQIVDIARDGDTIILMAQPYPYHPVTTIDIIGKDLNIRGEFPEDPSAVVLEMYNGDDGTAYNAFSIVDSENSVLSGFTVRGYNIKGPNGASPSGAGMPGQNGFHMEGSAFYIWDSSPLIKNVVITNCSATGGNGGNGAKGDPDIHGGHGGWPGWGYGGGVYIRGNSKPVFENCVFSDLHAIGGDGGNGGDGNAPPAATLGGLGGCWYYEYNTDPASPVDEIHFRYYTGRNGSFPNYPSEFVEDEHAPFGFRFVWPHGSYRDYAEYSGRGGAVYVDSGSSPTFKDCDFEDCSSSGGTCGLAGLDASATPRPYPAVHYVIDNGGGAVYLYNNSSAVFEGCEFRNNTAYTTAPSYNDDQFVSYGGAMCFHQDAQVTIEDCVFEGNKACAGGSLFSKNSTPHIESTAFNANEAYLGGGIFAVDSVVEMLRCGFTGNNATSAEIDPTDEDAPAPLGTVGSGGGIYSWGNTSVMYDLVLSGNSAVKSGGGMYIGGERLDMIHNALIANNTSGRDGAGISVNWYGQLELINATIADNAATDVPTPDDPGSFGGGLYCSYDAFAEVYNSILWGNTAENGQQIAVGSSFEYDILPSTVNVYSSNVQGGISAQYRDSGDPATPQDDCTLWFDGYCMNGVPTDSPDFTSGEYGDYYLSVAGIDPNQTETSPCFDMGDASYSMCNFYRHTTRTDRVMDSGNDDLGFHYVLHTDLKGDFNFDYAVKTDDYLKIATEKWLADGCCFPDWCEDVDINRDTRVDNVDLAIVTNSFGDDNTAPWPNPMRWELKPSSVAGSSEVHMSAVEAVDNSGCAVEYRFWRIDAEDPNDTVGVPVTLWQLERELVDTGLVVGHSYGYYVIAREVDDRWIDKNQDGVVDPGEKVITPNPTVQSVTAYVTVGADNTPPSPLQAAWSVAPQAVDSSSVTMTAATATDVSGPVMYFFKCTSGGGHDSSWQESPTYTDTGLTPETTYSYQVRTKDAVDNFGVFSEEASATTPVEGGTVDPPFDLSNVTVNTVSGTTSSLADGTWHIMQTPMIAADTEKVLSYMFKCSEGGYSSVFIKDGDPTIFGSSPPSELWIDGDIVHYKVKISDFQNTNVNWEWKVIVKDPSGQTKASDGVWTGLSF